MAEILSHCRESVAEPEKPLRGVTIFKVIRNRTHLIEMAYCIVTSPNDEFCAYGLKLSCEFSLFSFRKLDLTIMEQTHDGVHQLGVDSLLLRE